MSAYSSYSTNNTLYGQQLSGVANQIAYQDPQTQALVRKLLGIINLDPASVPPELYNAIRMAAVSMRENDIIPGLGNVGSAYSSVLQGVMGAGTIGGQAITTRNAAPIALHTYRQLSDMISTADGGIDTTVTHGLNASTAIQVGAAVMASAGKGFNEYRMQDAIRQKLTDANLAANARIPLAERGLTKLIEESLAGGVEEGSTQHTELTRTKELLHRMQKDGVDFATVQRAAEAGHMVREWDDLGIITGQDVHNIQQAASGTMSVITAADGDKLKDSIRKATESIAILADVMNTQDITYLQKLTDSLGWGSLTAVENARKVQNELDNAVAIASATGKPIQSVLMERAAIAGFIGSYVGGSDMVSASSLNAIQAIRNNTYGNTGDMYSADERMANYTKSMLNAESLFSGIALARYANSNMGFLPEDVRAQLANYADLASTALNEGNWEEAHSISERSKALLQSRGIQVTEQLIQRAMRDHGHSLTDANVRTGMASIWMDNYTEAYGAGAGLSESDMRTIASVFGSDIAEFSSFMRAAEGGADSLNTYLTNSNLSASAQEELKQLIASGNLNKNVGDFIRFQMQTGASTAESMHDRIAVQKARWEGLKMDSEMVRINSGISFGEALLEGFLGTGGIKSEDAVKALLIESLDRSDGSAIPGSINAGKYTFDSDALSRDKSLIEGVVLSGYDAATGLYSEDKARAIIANAQYSAMWERMGISDESDKLRLLTEEGIAGLASRGGFKVAHYNGSAALISENYVNARRDRVAQLMDKAGLTKDVMDVLGYAAPDRGVYNYNAENDALTLNVDMLGEDGQARTVEAKTASEALELLAKRSLEDFNSNAKSAETLTRIQQMTGPQADAARKVINDHKQLMNESLKKEIIGFAENGAGIVSDSAKLSDTIASLLGEVDANEFATMLGWDDNRKKQWYDANKDKLGEALKGFNDADAFVTAMQKDANKDGKSAGQELSQVLKMTELTSGKGVVNILNSIDSKLLNIDSLLGMLVK